ncbi:MAG: heavy metal translocating P-type ATPase [Desulfovibrio sp.]|nr:heavy metal translocating P-type ATPase [Desulfovibrio sp.]
MKFEIVHELPATERHPHRVRLRCAADLTPRAALLLAHGLAALPGLTGVSVNHRTGRVLFFAESPEARAAALAHVADETCHTARHGITPEEIEKIVTGENPVGGVAALVRFFIVRPFLPWPLRAVVSTAAAIPFILKGCRSLARGRLNVDVLDASALTVSLLMRDFRTVSLLTMLLAVGDALEVWTRQRALASLTESLTLDVDSVWVLQPDGTEAARPLGQVRRGDLIVVNDGSSIPVDGIVESGEALVNQAAMTGESMPVKRSHGGAVYAGTIVEEGRLVIRVTQVGESTRLQQVVTFIEQSEKQKSAIEARYTSLANKAVPFTFALAGLVWLFTRNIYRASSVLLVDYSCALKLATPLAVLTAMRHGTQQGIAIRGGRYLEAIREADTLVFDKTGTLTTSQPSVAEVVAAPGHDPRTVLGIMACLEEHFPHPIARAIVSHASAEGIAHEEEHTEVKYVVAHGISSHLHGHEMYLGSRHYIEHDEGVDLAVFADAIARETAKGHSVLFLAIDGKAAGMVSIQDPLRPEARQVVSAMRALGFGRILMITGDGEKTARTVANELGITEFRAHVLPTDKGKIVMELTREGCKVMMVGDGINDGPALSAASVGVAMGDGTDLARAVANVVFTNSTLCDLVKIRLLAARALARIHTNARLGIGLNSLYLLGAIALGLPPALTAVLHNLTTIGISLNAIRPYSVAKAYRRHTGG